METKRIDIADFSPDHIKSLLKAFSVIYVSFPMHTYDDWWHAVVLYDVKVNSLNEGKYFVMNPTGRWINPTTFKDAGYQIWKKGDFFPAYEDILIGWKVHVLAGKAL